MRPILAILCFSLAAGCANAQRLDWKLTDFAPLTSVPWDKAGAALKDVLQTIFREPEPDIRYPVLAAYLEMIPVSEMEEAFCTCVHLEGSQNPDELVNHFLGIWGRRDPEAAWKKARALFDAIVIDGDPLMLDDWERDPTRVVDWDGFRRSEVWFYRRLDGVGTGIEQSSLPVPEKARLLKEFAVLTIDRLGVLPRADLQSFASADLWASRGVVAALVCPVAELRDFILHAPYNCDAAAVKAGMVRWLDQNPGEAAEILKLAEDIVFPPYARSAPVSGLGTPSRAFLMLWAKLDLPAMLRWTESQEMSLEGPGIMARGLLLGRVDEATRRRWLREAGANAEEDVIAGLFGEWSRWDPVTSLKRACETQKAYIIAQATEGAVAPLRYRENTSHYGLGMLRDFDFGAVMATLPDEELNYMHGEWGFDCMETWVHVDVAEAAQWGWRILADPRTKFIPREHLIKLLQGDDEFASDGDMIDRTFCALRFWSVWKPDEMRQWIATLADVEMQKALTWLLEHPTGRAKKEPEATSAN